MCHIKQVQVEEARTLARSLEFLSFGCPLQVGAVVVVQWRRISGSSAPAAQARRAVRARTDTRTDTRCTEGRRGARSERVRMRMERLDGEK